jgi:hypothetical protein
MKVIYLIIGYITLSATSSFTIVDLYLNKKIIEDIGSAWKANFIIVNVIYLPALLIFLFLILHNKMYLYRMMASGLFLLLLFHIATYCFGLNLIWAITSQFIFVSFSFYLLKRLNDSVS